jgi:hypothetical protein
MQEHPELSKADKKRLCRLIDCRKLSPEVRAEAISNDRMPLRTIVQLLFVEQERTIGGAGASHGATAAVAPDRGSVDAMSEKAARTREEKPEPSSADHRSEMHRTRGDRGLAVADATAMTRSLSASTTTAAPAAARKERGSRMKNKQ